MEITEVKIHLRNEEKLKAYATITIDGCFVVRDLKIIQGNTGLFVAMPSKKKPDGSFKDIAHPLNNETREMIERKLLEAFKAEQEGNKDQQQPVKKAETQKAGADRGSTASIDRTMSDLEKSLESKFNSI